MVYWSALKGVSTQLFHLHTQVLNTTLQPPVLRKPASILYSMCFGIWIEWNRMQKLNEH